MPPETPLSISSRKAPEAVHDREQAIVGSAVANFDCHPQPEFGPFGLLDPGTQDLFEARAAHADGQVHRFVLDRAFVANLDPQAIENHDRLGPLQRSHLPRRDLIEYRIDHRRRPLRRDLNPVHHLQVRLDVAPGHSPGIHGRRCADRNRESVAVLRNQRRLEAPLGSRGIDRSRLTLSVTTVFALAPLRKLPAACSLS
jgi:hypothetical protein